MGYEKDRMMQLEERGYVTSTKKVCSCCVQDEYLKKLIRLNGEVGECDYCKDQKGRKVKTRKVVTVEKLMSFMNGIMMLPACFYSLSYFLVLFLSKVYKVFGYLPIFKIEVCLFRKENLECRNWAEK